MSFKSKNISVVYEQQEQIVMLLCLRNFEGVASWDIAEDKLLAGPKQFGKQSIG